MQALFHLDGERFVPSELTRGPWRPDAQHGGPPSALLGRAVEAEAACQGGRVARVGVELVRPVPLVPLRVTTRVDRVSRRVTHVDADLSTGDDVVARARALVLHVTVVEPIEERAEPDLPELESVAPAPQWSADDGLVTYHADAVEHRFAAGAFGQPGPAVDWIRLRVPLVAGEGTSGLCRTLAVADFGSGVSALFGEGSPVGLINADLTLALHRPPAGEWIRLASVSRLGPDGVGLCTTQLADRDGPFGSASQSLLAITAPVRA